MKLERRVPGSIGRFRSFVHSFECRKEQREGLLPNLGVILIWGK